VKLILFKRVINRALLVSESIEVDRYKREINMTMKGEFREDIEVILYKREVYKIDKLMTIEELQI
jgi:hypothetical protein